MDSPTKPRNGNLLTLIVKENDMKAFIAGTVFGLVLATVGFGGIAKMLDRGVDTVKEKSVEMAK
jgi:hypothetical protein